MSVVMKRIGNMGLVPVVVFDNANLAVPAAKALMDGGLDIMEITLRTEAGIPAIKKVKEAYPYMLVGAGTVLSVDKAKEAVAAGAEFIVAPGFNPDVVKWCIDNGIAITPGCVTPTEIEQALGFGLTTLKFFPANVYGGINGCKALHGPYRMVKFIPTGGINKNNLSDFADKPYIHAIGGGWLCKSSDINAQNFDAITKAAAESIDMLLGFELAHVGVAADEYYYSRVKKALDKDIDFTVVQDGLSIDKAKLKEPEATGYVAVVTNNIKRAVYYLKKRGYDIRYSTGEGEQRTVFIYLKDEAGELQACLLQKPI